MRKDVNWLDWPLYVMHGGAVVRFHAIPMLKPCSDAEHMWGVALMYWRITGGMPKAHVLMACITHDTGEQAAGDVPLHTKLALGMGHALSDYEDGIRDRWGMDFGLTDYEQRQLELADRLECMLYLCKERFMGNTFADKPYERTRKAALNAIVTDEEKATLVSIERVWWQASHGDNPGFDCMATPIGEAALLCSKCGLDLAFGSHEACGKPSPQPVQV